MNISRFWVRQLSKGSVETESLAEVVYTGNRKRVFIIILAGVRSHLFDFFDHTIDNYAVRHAIKKHGNDRISLRPSDFALIPEIIRSADVVNYNLSRNGNRRIVYTKEYKNRIVYVEEMRANRHELAMVTMYWQPSSKK